MGRTRFAIALFGLIAILLPSLAHADLTTGLIAHWAFDGNATDSAHNYDLTLVGNPGFGPGRFGQALQLNGTNTQYAVRPIDDPAFDFGAGDFTIQIWANFNQHLSEQTLIEKFTGGGGPGWTFTTPFICPQFYTEPAGFAQGCYPLPTGEWEQYVVERSGNSLLIYVDGNLLAVGSVFGALPASTNPLLIGRRDAADGRNFNVNGSLDDAAIWNRALSQSEIQYLFNNPVPIPEPATMVLVFSGLGAAVLRRFRR